MDNFCNLLFQLMKHGTYTLHVAFIFMFSILRRYLITFLNLDQSFGMANMLIFGQTLTFTQSKPSVAFSVPKLGIQTDALFHHF